MKSTLPHRDSDPVMMLYTHYFLASELMQKIIESSKKKEIRTIGLVGMIG